MKPHDKIQQVLRDIVRKKDVFLRLVSKAVPQVTVTTENPPLNCLKCASFCCKLAGYVEVRRRRHPPPRRPSRPHRARVRGKAHRREDEEGREADQVRLRHLPVPRSRPQMHGLFGAPDATAANMCAGTSTTPRSTTSPISTRRRSEPSARPKPRSTPTKKPNASETVKSGGANARGGEGCATSCRTIEPKQLTGFDT